VTGYRLAVCLGAAAFVLLGVANLFGIQWIDEPYQVYPAWRLNEGETLYRDVFVLTTPLHYYLLAGCQRILGAGLLAGRLLMALLGAVQCSLVFLIARRFVTARGAAIAAALSFVCLLLPVVFATYTATATTLLLLGLWLLVGGGEAGAGGAQRSGARTGGARMLLAGFCLGLAGAAKQDVGLAALVAGVILLWGEGPSHRERWLALAGFAAAIAALLLFAAGEGFLGPMLRIVLREATSLKSFKLLQYTSRMFPLFIYWGAILTVTSRWLARGREGRALATLLGATVVWIAVCIALNHQTFPVPYGASYGLLTALFLIGHGLVLARGVTAAPDRSTDTHEEAQTPSPLRRLTIASLAVFAICLLAGTDLPHVIQAMPLCFLPLVASWERFPALRRSLTSLAAATAFVFVALRIGGWHYAYASFPPLPACRAWSAGVLVPPPIAADLRFLSGFFAAAPPPADGGPLTLTSYPSALPNFLTGVPSPLYRFTFYFETPPELTRHSPFVLVLNEGRAVPGELPPELRETYADYRELVRLNAFSLWAPPAEHP
jgi:hypothetical protein